MRMTITRVLEGAHQVAIEGGHATRVDMSHRNYLQLVMDTSERGYVIRHEGLECPAASMLHIITPIGVLRLGVDHRATDYELRFVDELTHRIWLVPMSMAPNDP